MASITAKRAEISQNKVREIEDIFQGAGVEFYRTGSNLTTLTFDCGQIDGQTVYGSIKFTLHKMDYNLDDEIEEFEMLLEERKKKEEEKRRRDEKALKDRAVKEAKAQEKKTIEEREKEKRKEYLASVEKSG